MRFVDICFNIIVKCSSTLEYGIDSENLSLSAIRTIRVLRPLRAINRIPSKCCRDPFNNNFTIFFPAEAILPRTCDDFHRQKTFYLEFSLFRPFLFIATLFTVLSFCSAWLERVNAYFFLFLLQKM